MPLREYFSINPYSDYIFSFRCPECIIVCVFTWILKTNETTQEYVDKVFQEYL